jgi:hypothetical protein
MNRLSAPVLLMLLIAATVFARVKTEKVDLKEVKDNKYAPGQVWRYKTRPDEEGSTLTILRVEQAPLGKRIVHIHLDGIQLKNCLGGNAPERVEHMPFDKESLDASVIELVGKSPVPDYESGYMQWRRGWDAGKAGVYTITVSQAIDVMQQIFSKGIGCPTNP